MTKPILTQELLKELLHYDPDTGFFTWKRRDRRYFLSDQSWRSFNTKHSGNVAGSKNGHGYVAIDIFGRQYAVHRLAFLYMIASMPDKQVDHISGVRSDNRWSNIREASIAENSRNCKLNKGSKTGVMGVLWREERGKYQVNINDNGKRLHLGSYEDFFEASCARKSAEIKYGYHDNHGRR